MIINGISATEKLHPEVYNFIVSGSTVWSHGK